MLYEHFEIVLKTYKRVSLKRKTDSSTDNNTMSMGDSGSGTTAKKVYQDLKRIIDLDESG